MNQMQQDALRLADKYAGNMAKPWTPVEKPCEVCGGRGVLRALGKTLITVGCPNCSKSETKSTQKE